MKKHAFDFIFPEIFVTGKLPLEYSKESLISDGLCGWGCCMAGGKIPENFGIGMALIGGITSAHTLDELSKLADDILSKMK